MSTKKKEVQIAQEEALPAYLQAVVSSAPEGSEDITKEDWIIPRVQIVQSLSPEKSKLEAKYIPGIEEGDLFNTISRENLGKSIRLIPVHKSKSRAKFTPKEQGGGIQCRSADGNTGGAVAEQMHHDGQISEPTCDRCPHAEWGTGKDGKGQACTQFINVLSVLNKPNTVPTLADLVSVSFKSSGIKPAKNWLTQIKTESIGKGLPIYAQVWNLDVVPDQSANAEKFFNWVAWRDTVKFPSEKAFAFCAATRKSIIETVHEVDYSDLEPTENSATHEEYA